MNCQFFHDLIGSYLEQNLDQGQTKKFEEHGANCPACRADLEKSRQTISILKGFYTRLENAQPHAPAFRVPAPAVPSSVSEGGVLMHLRCWLTRAFSAPALAFGVVCVLAGIWMLSRPNLPVETFPEKGQYAWVLGDSLASVAEPSGSAFHRGEWLFAAADTTMQLNDRNGVPAVQMTIKAKSLLSASPHELLVNQGDATIHRTVASLPFRVLTPHVQLSLIGTRLRVLVSSQTTSVELTHGSLLAQRDREAIRMFPGQRLEFGKGIVGESLSHTQVASGPEADRASVTTTISSVASGTLTSVVSSQGRVKPAQLKLSPQAIASSALESSPAVGSASEADHGLASGPECTNPEEVFLHD